MRGIRRTLVSVSIALGAGACLVLASAQAVSAASSPSQYTIWRIAGSSVECSTPPSCGDGGSATAAKLSFPQAVTLGPGGVVVIADWGDNEVREVSPTGSISPIAGDGTVCQKASACGDGGSATAAQLSVPDGVAVDSAGDVYIADTGDNEIRKVSPSGTITRVAGTGAACARPPSCGDGGPGTSATLNSPSGLALDKHGNLFIADTGDQEVRELSAAGTMTRVAGTGAVCSKPPSCGDGALATAAQLAFPQAVAVSSGSLYVADTGDQEIRKISPLGSITRVAGTGSACSTAPSCGDGGPGASAQLSYPTGVAVDPGGDVYIADTVDNEVRLLSSAGTITRLAGTGAACAHPPGCGDNRHATSATLDYPEGIATDNRGNVYVGDTSDNEVRWLSAAHTGRMITASGPVAVAAFASWVKRTSVIVRYALGRAAQMTLDVGHHHHTVTVARAQGVEGFGELAWNRRFEGQRAPHGRYTLTLTATIGSHHATSTIHVKL
jgi:sugar lactone lactonase YvrE